MPDSLGSKQEIHQAITHSLDDGEIAIAWTLTIDVAGKDGTRYLAHRAGGGSDGSDMPMVWTALGMLKASLQLTEQQLAAASFDVDEEEDDEWVGWHHYCMLCVA